MASGSASKDANSQPAAEEETYPLTGKPYIDIILSKLSVKPGYYLNLPAKAFQYLPGTDAPAVLTYRGKNWHMRCSGSTRLTKKFDQGWKAFVDDNKLDVGDACVFEFMESSAELVEVKVQILRGDIPASILERESGERSDAPIRID